MGVFWKNNKGVKCTPTEDGGQHCIRVKKDKEGNLIHDGTEFTIIPGEDCSPRIQDLNLMDGDEEIVNSISKKVSLSCKRNRGMA